jgi:hypothetical protein
MTAADLAMILHARRYRRGQWFAKCPVHREKTASLSIRDVGGKRISVHCFGCGANGKQVMGALGLKASDLFTDGGTSDPRIRERIREEQTLERIRRELLDIDKRVIRLNTEKTAAFVKRRGWDKLWELFMASDKGKAVATEWGIQ